jgi:hypothetical protein
MTGVDPAPWHVDPVNREDDRKLSEIMDRWSAETGEQPSKAGTIRRAVRELHKREVGNA